jgi:ATP-dependent RNA helicase SUPV3L1/SUV3
VALYQAGEVDYLVATDAIGMGLNLDIDHVAFAELAKFDGSEHRPLTSAELAQIAGRAGRHLNDGSFGTLAPVDELPPRVARDMENHRFPPVRQLHWRNRELDFDSVDGLLASLRRRPGPRCLRLMRRADDAVALERLACDPEVKPRLDAPGCVPLLWEVCQIPDYRQLMLEDHVDLLKQVFLQLRDGKRRLDQDWMERRIQRVSRADGDIEDLLLRMAFIRTWTYITHRSTWVTDAGHWQERTREAEDRLSDALHQRLVERFVESSSRASVGPTRGAGGDAGPLRDGSAFAVLAKLARPDTSRASAEAWLEEILEAPHERFSVDATGRIRYGDTVLARLKRGRDLPRPEVVLVDGVAAGRAAGQRLARRLGAWARDLVSEVVAPLRDQACEGLSPAGRGLVYQLECGLGTTSVRSARAQLRTLTEEDRALLQGLGVCLGRRHVYLAGGLKPALVARRLALCAAWWGYEVAAIQPAPSAVSLVADPRFEAALYQAIGFPLAGPLGVRADVLERVDARLLSEAPGPWLGRLLGAPRPAVAGVIQSLGYRPLADRRRSTGRRRPRHERASD